MFCWKPLRTWSTSTSPFGPRMTLFLRSFSRASSNLLRPSSIRETSALMSRSLSRSCANAGAQIEPNTATAINACFMVEPLLLVLVTTQQHCQSPRPEIRPDIEGFGPRHEEKPPGPEPPPTTGRGPYTAGPGG